MWRLTARVCPSRIFIQSCSTVCASSDIDAVLVLKSVMSSELASFLGDTLKLKEGVFLTNFSATDTNRILHDPLVVPLILPSPLRHH